MSPKIAGGEGVCVVSSIIYMCEHATDSCLVSCFSLGIMMIVAWICVAGIGVFMPRFMKKAWPTPEGGVARWFKVS